MLDEDDTGNGDTSSWRRVNAFLSFPSLVVSLYTTPTLSEMRLFSLLQELLVQFGMKGCTRFVHCETVNSITVMCELLSIFSACKFWHSFCLFLKIVNPFSLPFFMFISESSEVWRSSWNLTLSSLTQFFYPLLRYRYKFENILTTIFLKTVSVKVQ